MKSFLSLSGGARHNARIDIETDGDLPLDQEVSSNSNDFATVDSDEEDDKHITLDIADRRAQEVIDHAAIDLVAAAIQLDENSGDGNGIAIKSPVIIESPDIVEIEEAMNKIDEMISENSQISCQVMQTATSLHEEK